ncbi:MAG: hypothetical protein HKN77_07430 [Woeseiaceae bacterium]|nr:hypothetical protein [Woeseiaceae bacterium]
MPDSKNVKWLDDYTDGSQTADKAEEVADAVAPVEPAANDADGWQQYRHWISKAPAPRSRRSGIDPALYSWKGYRSWTENVKRNWTRDSDTDE